MFVPSRPVLPNLRWYVLYLSSLRSMHFLACFIFMFVDLCYHVPKDDLKKSSTEFSWDKDLLLQNLLVANKYHHNSLRSCCCSLLVSINVLKRLYASFSKSRPLSQLQNRDSPLLRLRLMFPSFFRCALLPYFNKIVERELLVLGVQQIEDIFSIVFTNLRTWLSMFGMG
jgi:hypothetical protein